MPWITPATRTAAPSSSRLSNNGPTKQPAGVEGRTHIQIHTPLIALSKADIVRLAAQLGVDFRLTHSCYDPDEEGHPCGQCDSCLLRQKGFAEAGIRDPLVYTS